MPITSLHAFLIHPGKNDPGAPRVSGDELDRDGKLFQLLEGIFSAEPDARDFEVTFNPAPDGTQQNDRRDLLLKHQQSGDLKSGMKIARRLQAVTDNRSGIGLLFLISGTRGLKHRVVVSRFPAAKLSSLRWMNRDWTSNSSSECLSGGCLPTRRS